MAPACEGPRYTAPMHLRLLSASVVVLALSIVDVAVSGRADRTGRGSAARTAPASRPRPSVPTEFGPAEEPALAPAAAAGALVADSLQDDRIYLTAFRGDALVTIADRSAEGPDPVGAAGAAGQDEGRRQAQQPGVAESGGRRERRLRLLPRLRPDCLRRAPARSCGRCRSARSTTSTGWARRR